MKRAISMLALAALVMSAKQSRAAAGSPLQELLDAVGLVDENLPEIKMPVETKPATDDSVREAGWWAALVQKALTGGAKVVLKGKFMGSLADKAARLIEAPGGGRACYVIGRANRKTSEFTAEGVVLFTSNMTVNGYYQAASHVVLVVSLDGLSVLRALRVRQEAAPFWWLKGPFEAHDVDPNSSEVQAQFLAEKRFWQKIHSAANQ